MTTEVAIPLIVGWYSICGLVLIMKSEYARKRPTLDSASQ